MNGFSDGNSGLDLKSDSLFQTAQQRKYSCQLLQTWEIKQGEIVLACFYVLVNFCLDFTGKISTEQDELACSSERCLRTKTPYGTIL